MLSELAMSQGQRASLPPFAGLSMEGRTRPVVMGIVNVTPDSFSDGGDRFDPEAALTAALAQWEAGAEILDIGGESTRPGAAPISPDEEQRRILPVVRALANRGLRVSVDTRHASTMAAAVQAGAAILNDITALDGDPKALAVAARCGVPVILMHMQGQPQTMQQAPHYSDAPQEVFDYLATRIAACEAAGIPRSLLCVDPGIGFGKTLDHNRAILSRLGLYHRLGCPVLLGASRKSLISHIMGRDVPPKQRLGGSLALALAAAAQGVQIVRVHDVAETVQALRVWESVFYE